ncbi:MAG: hypothetical protein V7785_08220 [Bermanella sp.]
MITMRSIKFPVLFLLFMTFSILGNTSDLARAANDNPFLQGELNPLYEGHLTALGGTVEDIIEGPNNTQLFKLNLKLKGIKAIWVTTFVRVEEGQVSIGDELIFRGYISVSGSLDPSGEIKSLINADTLLLAIKIQNPNNI